MHQRDLHTLTHIIIYCLQLFFSVYTSLIDEVDDDTTKNFTFVHLTIFFTGDDDDLQNVK